VLTRDEEIPKLRNVVVALITRTVRGIETEVQLDASDGMPRVCAISLDNLRTVPKTPLVEPITELDTDKMTEVCKALEAASGCR
jgi:mRNA interferase MazF